MLATFMMIGYRNTHEQVNVIVKANGKELHKFCMVQTNNFTQLCCLKHYSVVHAWKFELFFHAIILYYEYVYCGTIFKCNQLKVC